MRKPIFGLFGALAASLVFTTSCSSEPDFKVVVNKEIADKLDPSFKTKNFKEADEFFIFSPDNYEEAEALKKNVLHVSHEAGKCGGFSEFTEEEILKINKTLREQNILNNSFDESLYSSPVYDEKTAELLNKASIEHLRTSIDLLVGQGTRSARSRTPNRPIEAFINHVQESLKSSKVPFTVDRIVHNRTNQDSIRVRIEGESKPEEVVILGGHIDSTASFFSNKAPGADDNASGSAVILEVLRLIAESEFRPARSLEFFWYAGEENGLIGSKEIAENYRANSVDVKSVMQLDMVLYPGNGDKIGLTTDFTNVELTKFVEDLTGLYVGSPVERFRCGYGCSDHASWHQQGFKTVYPFESTFDTHNRNIHTERDVVDSNSSLEHALKFVKIAASFMLEQSKTKSF